MQTKVVTQSISSAANTTTQSQIVTQDDNQIRTIIGVWANDTTKLVRTGLALQGKVIVDYDDSFNALLKEPFPCNIVFPAGVQITLQLLNGTAGAINNVNVAIVYTVAN